jgi:osmotically-inducible protein OsmY
MKHLIPYAVAAALAAGAIAGCTKSGTNSAYNNSGTSATPAQTTTTTTTTTDTSSSSTTTGANVVTDTVTTGRIQAAFASDSALKDSDIMVKTDGGVVVLSGTAASSDQITIATNLAKAQEGVSRVETQIVLK